MRRISERAMPSDKAIESASAATSSSVESSARWLALALIEALVVITSLERSCSSTETVQLHAAGPEPGSGAGVEASLTAGLDRLVAHALHPVGVGAPGGLAVEVALPGRMPRCPRPQTCGNGAYRVAA
jgi:hypothetical protein